MSPYMTCSEAAAYLRCNAEVLRRWVRDGRINPHRAGSKLLFTQSMLDRFVRGN